MSLNRRGRDAPVKTRGVRYATWPRYPLDNACGFEWLQGPNNLARHSGLINKRARILLGEGYADWYRFVLKQSTNWIRGHCQQSNSY